MKGPALFEKMGLSDIKIREFTEVRLKRYEILSKTAPPNITVVLWAVYCPRRARNGHVLFTLPGRSRAAVPPMPSAAPARLHLLSDA
jgi:hypothetical protein